MTSFGAKAFHCHPAALQDGGQLGGDRYVHAKLEMADLAADSALHCDQPMAKTVLWWWVVRHCKRLAVARMLTFSFGLGIPPAGALVATDSLTLRSADATRGSTWGSS